MCKRCQHKEREYGSHRTARRSRLRQKHWPDMADPVFADGIHGRYGTTPWGEDLERPKTLGGGGGLSSCPKRKPLNAHSAINARASRPRRKPANSCGKRSNTSAKANMAHAAPGRR